MQFQANPSHSNRWRNAWLGMLLAVSLSAITHTESSLAQELSTSPATSTDQLSGGNTTAEKNAISQAEVRSLIEQLGASEFVQREVATSALLAAGEPALEQLRRAVGDANVERQVRLGTLISRIEYEQFQMLSESFLVDADPEASHGLPAWQAYSAVVGASRSSKLLFLDMLREQSEIAAKIQAVTDASQSTPAALATATEELDQTVRAKATLIFGNRMRLIVPEIGDLVALLVATTMLGPTSPMEVNELLDASVHVVPVSTYMSRRGYRETLRELYTRWLPKTHEAMAERAVYIALVDNYATGAEVARRHLDPSTAPRLREHAIQCLARFGTAEDVPALVELLSDGTQCGLFEERRRFSDTRIAIDESDESPPGLDNQKAKPDSESSRRIYVYRIQDLALAAAMMLRGEKPETVFENFDRNEVFGFVSQSVAVERTQESLATRRTAIEDWLQAYLAQLPKPQ